MAAFSRSCCSFWYVSASVMASSAPPGQCASSSSISPSGDRSLASTSTCMSLRPPCRLATSKTPRYMYPAHSCQTASRLVSVRKADSVTRGCRHRSQNFITHPSGCATGGSFWKYLWSCQRSGQYQHRVQEPRRRGSYSRASDPPVPQRQGR